jgi:hypothetical protein
MIKGLVPMVVLLGDGFLFKNNSHLGWSHWIATSCAPTIAIHHNLMQPRTKLMPVPYPCSPQAPSCLQHYVIMKKGD